MATFDTFKDFAATLVTSSYKWLTSTLLTAQQQFAVRPYVTVKVIDDTIQPNAMLFSGSGQPRLGRGSMVTAPDGSALAAGYDENGAVAFWKAPDLNAVGGVWPTKVVLDSGGTVSSSLGQVAISVSDYFNGSYQIDIWYFTNFGNDGSNMQVINKWSTDGGVNWNSHTSTISGMPNTNYPTDNISIAAMQTRNANGIIKSGCAYIIPNSHTFASGFTGYDIFTITADHTSGYGAPVQWSYNNADSFDWTLHSLTAFYLNGAQYIVFSGFHNILNSVGSNQNFSIWVSAFLNDQGSTGLNLWSQPYLVMPLGSTNSLDQNRFINPMATVSGSMAYITLEAILVDSVSQTAQGSTSAVVTTHTNYMIIQSDDARTFSYPSVMVYTDGTEFNPATTACFIQQGNYWYLGGSAGYLWQYVQNNVVADITSDVVGYSISEQAGQPSTISLKLGNANNKWVGSAPTGPGASAIARNRKIAVWQGYYNAVGTPEVVPRNIYFIDDIQQQVSGTQNDVLIVGRDLYKKMKTTITRFNYQFIGPIFYTDIFDGTTNQNWNQIVGTWTFNPTTNSVDGFKSGAEATMLLANVSFNTFGHSMRVFFLNTQTGTVYVYGMYVDSDNYLRCEINTATDAWAVVKRINGSNTTMDSGTLPTGMVNGDNYMILVKRFAFWDFNFIFSRGAGTGNELSVYDPSTQSYLLKNSGPGHYSIQSNVASTVSMQPAFSVGVGASATVTQRFKWFQLAIYNNSNNVGEIMRGLARISGTFSFKLVKMFRELLYTTTQFNGTFTVLNRIISVTAGNVAISSINSMTDGEISFKAKIAASNINNDSGFQFLFRSDSATTPTAVYYFHLIRQGGTGTATTVVCRFERLFSGTTYRFYNSAEDVQNNPQFSTTFAVNIDPLIEHTYRIVMVNGQLFAFIDDIMVAAWNDDNVTAAYLKSGYWGFAADTNTTVSVEQISAPILWKPVPSVSFNPGDDVESVVTALATSLKFWVFSDLFGRFKALFLSTSDPTTYTYNTQLFQQNVDSSDKEYVSQVTVYGNGVSATARNTTLMPGVPVRELVIVDYTILTQADAQTRANNDLVNSNQYLSQNQSKQVINVGAELFDVVTVTNTGNNTSGVNGPTRVYDQSIDQGGGNNNTEYFLEIDTGNV